EQTDMGIQPGKLHSPFHSWLMQCLTNPDEEHLITSGTRYSIKGFRFEPPYVLKRAAGHLCHGHVPIVLQLLCLTLSAVLLLAVLIKVSSIANMQGREQAKKEKVYKEMSQLKPQISLCQVHTSPRLEGMPGLPGSLTRGMATQNAVSEGLKAGRARKWTSKHMTILTKLLPTDRLCRPCPWDWTLFQGNCYFFSKFQQNWHDSVTACREVGAQLVVIKSDEEQSFLQQMSKEKGYAWMGLSDLKHEGMWHWLDGSHLLFRQ
ncbi:hypothetical protein U0070_013386, partial [Myodes glareolus]